MGAQATNTVTQFLTPTRLCDCDGAGVNEKAKDLVGIGGDPTEAALNIFYFVRDRITFGLDFPDARASETLVRGIGFCMTKHNLQMALLRAAGIPSRSHLVQLPKDVNKPITPKFLYDRTPAEIIHPWCECLLDGKWVACDCVMDDAFYRAMLRRGYLTEVDMPSIDWDGKTDLIFGESKVRADLGTFPSWDEGIREARKSGGMPPTNRLLGPIVYAMFNRRIRKIRTS